jgi:PPP family 3-phenylpropionic acid transporter
MRDLFVFRLCLFYAAQFVVIGIQMPFFPVWLADRGLDPRAIGIILAAPMIVRVPIVPIATRLADRFGAVRGAIVTALAMALMGYLLASVAGGFLALFATVLLALIAFGMTFPLGDAYALRGLGERGRPYGPVRLWGSIAYIAANVGGGLLAGMMRPGDLIWLIVAACAGTLIVSTGLPARTVDDLPRPGEPAGSHAKLWRTPAFVLTIGGASLIQASHALYYGFSTIDWAAKGLNGTMIGMLWGLAVVCEIVLFAFAARLPVAIGAVELIGIGALGAVMRWAMMALDPPLLTLPFLQCLHALSFGATYLGTMQFLTRIVPPSMAATAQGDLSAAQGIMVAGATGLSGGLYAAYGDLAYAAMAAAAGAGGLVVIALAWTTRGD